jgi:hypothetical protein
MQLKLMSSASRPNDMKRKFWTFYGDTILTIEPLLPICYLRKYLGRKPLMLWQIKFGSLTSEHSILAPQHNYK